MKRREFYPVPKFRQFKPYRTFKKYPWYARSASLRYVIAWIIWLSTFSDYIANRGKFKVGDRVKYNWMAKVQLYSPNYHGDFEGIRAVTEILYHDESGLQFSDDTSSDPFWVRALYFWEK